MFGKDKDLIEFSFKKIVYKKVAGYPLGTVFFEMNCSTEWNIFRWNFPITKSNPINT